MDNLRKSSALLLLLGIFCMIGFSVSEDHSADDCESAHLFGSKTAYSQRLFSCLAKDNELFDAQSLEASHKKLVDEENCKPVALYLIRRHGARQPSPEEIDQITGDLVGKFDGNKGEFSKWRSPFSVERANLVTNLGADADREIARRLARIYPKFFDTNTANVELATTSKLRTLQSGLEFAKEVTNFRVEMDKNSDAMCRRRTSAEDFECGGRATEQDLKCLESLLPKYNKIQMEAHKICKKQIKLDNGNELSAQHKPNKKRSDLLGKIDQIKLMLLDEAAAKIKEKLSLELKPTVSSVSSAFEACAYETSAIYGTPTKSIWCNLFDREQFEALEYLDDAKIYHQLAPNRDSLAILSSPLFKDLLNQLAEASSSSSSPQLRAFFGFTHGGVLKKFLAALGFFDDDKQVGYSPAELEAFRQFRVVPKRRLWRSSLMVPFSGSIQFALYKCPTGGSGGDQFKLLTSIAERPVKVKGCDGSVCQLSDFLATYNTLQQYSIEQVCENVRNLMGK